MVKQRMATADVAAEVASLRQRGIVGMRLTNIYDINSKTYVLKLARTGEDGEKLLLLVESGSRFHSIDSMPDKTDIPSNFTLKLRKHVRTRRVESITQLGVDRIVQLTFGTGDNTFHLILEFYAQGNVILTDKSYEVLTLLRSHRDDAKGMATMARHAYPIHTVRLRQPVAVEALESGLKDAPADANLKSVVAGLMAYGPTVAEHCIRKARLDPGRAPLQSPLSAEEQSALMQTVREFEKWLDSCEEEGAAAPGGAIFTKKQKTVGGKDGAAGTAGDGDAAEEVVYEQFEPLMQGEEPFEQYKDAPMVKFKTFDEAMSEFFGKLSSQRAVAQQAQREKAAVGKLDAIRRDHEQRLEALAKETEAAERRAALIELNLDAVDAALNAVREALAGGMDWRDLARMIKEEKKAGNPVAALIDSLQLEKNKITVLLGDPLDDEEDEEEEESADSVQQQKQAKKQHKPHVEKVQVDLDLSAHANARAHYEARKKHVDKTRRTLEANEKALLTAEKKAQEALAKVRSTAQQNKSGAAAAAAARKPYWFEKFHWFISSENYLVLSGRDAQQNELLVKRYLRKGDVYVHADLHGASSTIIKNSDASKPIPPLTLSQAGQACVCRSAAWDAKVVTSAYWVHPEQVSKTAPSGEYLVTGSFMIRGRKNYLPPQQLVMGLAWLFRLGEESVAAHLGERAPRLDLMSQQDEVVAPQEESFGEMEEQIDGNKKEMSAFEAFMESSVDALLPSGAASAGGGAGGSQPVADAFDRYGLSDALHKTSSGVEYSEEPDELIAKLSGSATGAKQRHLSAKERKLMKKGGSEVAENAAGAEKQKKEAKQQPAAPAKQQPPPPQQGASRGVKSKAARRNKKYAEQDDEERELAMQLLQSAGQKKDRKQRKEERKAKMAARKAAKSGVAKIEVTEEDIAKLTARLALEPEAQADSSESEEENEEQGNGSSTSETGEASEWAVGAAGSEEQQEGNEMEEEENGDEEGGEQEEEDAAEEAARKERDEVAQLLAAEGVSMLDDVDKEKLTQLDELTGIPRAEDVVLYAVPVCAPYQVVAGYKYKVKIVPGNLKRGKAFKQAVELLAGRGAASGTTSGDPVAVKEKELIRAVPEMDGINAMLGGVKLQVAGLQKMQQAKKASKKKK